MLPVAVKDMTWSHSTKTSEGECCSSISRRMQKSMQLSSRCLSECECQFVLLFLYVSICKYVHISIHFPLCSGWLAQVVSIIQFSDLKIKGNFRDYINSYMQTASFSDIFTISTLNCKIIINSVYIRNTMS
jgi:hypothetical protein